ncbi:MAG TPA: tetratricopeptide repeat protein [Longimicrobiales bacterium]|nr:tetratricopeptide repeat protein [Longimicrobiales bacterium]
MRLALFYAVAGWIVIEAADVIFPALLLPEWAPRLIVAVVILGFPIALLLSWMFDLTPDGVKRTRRTADAERAAADDGGDPTGAPARGGAVPHLPTADPAPAAVPVADQAAEVAERSIAVLPFVNMSDDRDNEYFSDGMTEEILNALAKVRDLRVASRTSSFAFKGQDSDVLEIARQLRVGTVVEGSVRKAGNRIRVTAQLISADDGYHLWSESYDRELEDVFRVQDDIARSIVDALKVELRGVDEEHLVEPETADVEAYTLYLKGRFFFNRYSEVDLKRSLDIYRQALEHDPSYARAYAGMADTWMQLADDWEAPDRAYPEARKAAEKAIALDPRLPEAHTALGKVLGWFEWDFDGAELALRRAVGANRKYGDAHWGLGSILPATGLLDDAVEEMRLAVSIDPLSPVFNYWLSRFLYFRRQLDAAKEEAHRSIELDPTSFRPRLILGLCHLLEDRPEEALEAFESRAMEGIVSGRIFVARAHAAAGRPDEARRILLELDEGDEYIRSEFMAAGWASLGDLDRAFAALEQAYRDRSAGLIYLHVDPSYDPLRGDERYGELVERIGLRSEG